MSGRKLTMTAEDLPHWFYRRLEKNELVYRYTEQELTTALRDMLRWIPPVLTDVLYSPEDGIHRKDAEVVLSGLSDVVVLDVTVDRMTVSHRANLARWFINAISLTCLVNTTIRRGLDQQLVVKYLEDD